MQFRLTVEYDGSSYSGWQLQDGHDSIQERIERALQKIFAQPVRVRGSGRTDAGAHALGQVAAFTPPRPFAAAPLHRALNALLPPDIVVLQVEEAADSFDPRRHARSRIYEYRVLNQPLPSAFEYRYAWHVRDRLSLAALNGAARLFVGEHDFAAFRTLGSKERTTVRRVLASEWVCAGAKLVYRVEATAFLRHMVRAMVAAMVEVGRGRAEPATIRQLLTVPSRARPPAAAPPGGLFLVEVRY